MSVHRLQLFGVEIHILQFTIVEISDAGFEHAVTPIPESLNDTNMPIERKDFYFLAHAEGKLNIAFLGMDVVVRGWFCHAFFHHSNLPTTGIT